MFAAVDNRRDEHQSTIVETTGEIGGISCLVLFYSSSIDSFISSSLVERCRLVMVK